MNLKKLYETRAQLLSSWPRNVARMEFTQSRGDTSL